MCGYPLNEKKTQIMSSAVGPCTKSFLTYNIPTKSGQSGSPVIKREGNKEFIIGVHIGSSANFTKNIAVRLTPQKRKIINEWVGEMTGSLGLGRLALIQRSRSSETKK